MFCDSAAELLAGLDEPWEVALAAEPAPRRHVRDEQLDPICRAIADFADLKTPWTLGHSTGVAELAEAAAWRLDLDADRGPPRRPRPRPRARRRAQLGLGDAPAR